MKSILAYGLLVTLSSLLLTACPGGGDDDGGAAGAAGSAGASGGSGGGSSGTAGSAGAGSGGTSGASGASGTSGAAGSAGSDFAGYPTDGVLDDLQAANVESAPILPLAPGMLWNYDVTLDTAGDTCPRDYAKVGQQVTLSGSPAYEYLSSCSTLQAYLTASGDDVTFFIPASAAAPQQQGAVTASPVQEGTVFGSFTWQAAPQTTVPAGTFDYCWNRVFETSTARQLATYCRGVGMVVRRDYDLNDPTVMLFEMVLVARY